MNHYTPEETLALLDPVARSLRSGLDDGVSFADTTLHQQPYDPHLWTGLVRYRAFHYLKDAAVDAAWSFRGLPNSGIELGLGTYTVRTLRSLGDGPPNPGRNVARRGFYRQYHQYALAVDAIETGPGANLIIDWTLRDKREIAMALSKPSGVWKYKKKPVLEWRRLIEFDGTEPLRFSGDDGGDIDAVEWDQDDLGEEDHQG